MIDKQGVAKTTESEINMNKAIWCYAEGRPGDWEAVCLDFDLAVQGGSFDEVYRELNESISMYLEYIRSLPEDERARFLGRRIPFALRLRFILALLVSTLLKNSGNDRDCAGFLLHCQA